jgi:hypothetical protein
VVASQNGNRVVNVIGMHRCGTSLTARLLNLLGVDLGPESDRLEPRFDNPQGYWEQRPIVELNDAIFDALGGSWWRPPEMPAGWQRRPEVEALVPRARDVLAAQFGEPESAWGWKDPRTSLTLPFWRELIPQARYVVCLRNPIDVASSLLRREPRTHTWESAIALWLRYSAEALDNTRADERLLVFYEDFFSDGERQLARLAEFAGGDAPEVASSVASEAQAIVQADMRHHRTSAMETIDSETVPPEAGAFFLAVRAAHIASTLVQCDGDNANWVEPDLLKAATNLAPRLRHGETERKTAAVAERDRAVAAAKRERDEGIVAARGEAEAAISGAYAERDEAIAAAERERDEAIDAAEEERNQARHEERKHRIALDRALEELESVKDASDHAHEAAMAAARAERKEAVAAAQDERDGAIAAVEAERNQARHEEREHRIALDRALEELWSARGDMDDGERQRVESALAQARADLAHERRALAGVYGSLSWRLTAPLRSGKRIFRPPR